MKVLVCVKQVLDAETNLRITPDGQWFGADRDPRHQLNHFDAYALEAAVRLKEQYDDVSVDAVTVGPERTVSILQRAVGMGAGRGIRIDSDGEGYQDPMVVASKLAAIARGNYDLVLTGVMSEDLMQGLVGPMMAELLGWPCATAVIAVETADFQGRSGLRLEREIEGGRREILEMKLPALLTIQTGIDKPRYPTLSGMLRAKKMEMETVSPAEGVVNDASWAVDRVSYPQKTGAGLFLEGDSREKAAALVRILKEKSFL